MLYVFRIILCTAFFFTVVKTEAQESMFTEKPFSVSTGYVQGIKRLKFSNIIQQKSNVHGAYIGFRYDKPYKNNMVSYGTGARVLFLNETAYIQIPLEARVKIHDRVSLQAGPSFNFRPDQIGDDMDLNISLSTGVSIGVTSRLYLDVHYNHQLNNSNRSNILLVDEINLKMHVLTVGAGFRL